MYIYILTLFAKINQIHMKPSLYIYLMATFSFFKVQRSSFHFYLFTLYPHVYLLPLNVSSFKLIKMAVRYCT